MCVRATRLMLTPISRIANDNNELCAIECDFIWLRKVCINFWPPSIAVIAVYCLSTRAIWVEIVFYVC